MSNLCKMLRAAIEDEKKAIPEYQAIKDKMKGHKSHKNKITKIQNDEKEHRITLLKITKEHGCNIKNI